MNESHYENGFFILLILGVTLFYKLPELFYFVEIMSVFIFFLIVNRESSIRLNKILLSVMLFATYLGVNFVSMMRYEHTLWDFFTVAIQFFLVGILILSVSQFRKIKPVVLMRAWALAGLFVSMVTLYEYTGYLLGQQATFYIGSLPRAVGLFGEPSNLGHFLIPPAVILLVSFLQEVPLLKSKKRHIGSLAVVLLAMLLSLSQGAIATAIIVFTVIMLTYVSSIKRIIKIATGIGVPTGALALIPGVPIIRSYIIRFVFVFTFFF
jgi:hypothetical protein